MPSEDKFHSERPEVNEWLTRDESGKLREITQAERTNATSRTGKRVPMAAYVQALAARLGTSAETLAERIPADTMRRLKFPMLEHVEQDGLRTFKHDIGIIRDGVRALLATDRSNEPIKRNAPTARDNAGKFTKK